jgi:hypothetical protein
MEYNSINIVICTNKTKEECEKISRVLYDRAGCENHIFFAMNGNNVSISNVYQQMLDKEEVKKNVTIFMHDDVEIFSVGFGREILRLFKENEEYGIIGVAGSKQVNARQMWWLNEKKAGQVVHYDEKLRKCWLTTFSDKLKNDLEEVLVIDGLFIAVDPSRLKCGFDTRLNGFDFYDICFCLNNAKNGVKIGVTENIRLCHHSVGKMRENWYQAREILNHSLYGKYYPIDLDEGFIEKNADVEEYLKIEYEKIKDEMKKEEEIIKKNKEMQANENKN